MFCSWVEQKKKKKSQGLHFHCCCCCFYRGRGGQSWEKKQPKMYVITMPSTSDTARAKTKKFLIHLNVKATLAALPRRESPQAAKRPVVSHLFTPAAAGCHWDSEGEIPWFSLPFLTAPAQTTLIRDCGRAPGTGGRLGWLQPRTAEPREQIWAWR